MLPVLMSLVFSYHLQIGNARICSQLRCLNLLKLVSLVTHWENYSFGIWWKWEIFILELMCYHLYIRFTHIRKSQHCHIFMEKSNINTEFDYPTFYSLLIVFSIITMSLPVSMNFLILLPYIFSRSGSLGQWKSLQGGK